MIHLFSLQQIVINEKFVNQALTNGNNAQHPYNRKESIAVAHSLLKLSFSSVVELLGYIYNLPVFTEHLFHQFMILE